MKYAVVSDTSPLNYLVQIDAIDLLPRLFSEIIVPPAVFRELSQQNTPQAVRHWLSQPHEWLARRAPKVALQDDGLDPGESEAIALAEETRNCILLVDELKGRKVAKGRGIPVLGTLGVLEQASRQGWIEFEEFAYRLKGTNFRARDQLILDATERLKSK